MTTAAKLLARKQQLLERLQGDHPAPNERDEIERFLAQIDAALNFLDEAGLEKSNRQPSGSQRPAKIDR